jgi:hypothetical protein
MIALSVAMATREHRTDWLLWIAGAVTAPAFILAAIFFIAFVAVAMTRHYNETGPRILVSDGTVVAAYIAVQVLKFRTRPKWSLWLPCAAATAILAITCWLPALMRGTLFPALSGVVLADLIYAAPPIQKWMVKRAGAQRMAAAGRHPS